MNALSDWFENANYPEGRTGYAGWDSFVRLKDDAPAWLKAAVYKAHQGTLPNDWIYLQCQAACEAIEERDEVALEDADWFYEHVEGEVDVYTKDRFQWAAYFCLSDTFSEAEERAKELTLVNDTNERLGVIQYCAIEFITQTILDAYIDNRVDNVVADLSEAR